MHDYFRGNPDGRSPCEFLARARADPGRVPRPRRAARQARRARPRSGLAVPDPRHALRGAARSTTSSASRSRSPRSTAGSTRTGASTTRTASSRRRTSRSPTSTGRSRELEWALDRGARTVVMRPAAPHTATGRVPASDPRFDPFWARVQRGRHHRRRARGRQRLLVATATRPTGSRPAFSGRRPLGADRSRRSHIERAAYDFLITLVFDKLFERFPGRARRVGRERRRVPPRPVQASCARPTARCPATSPRTRSRSFRRNVWINPFWEDDVNEIVELMGADRVIFGSDWPHIEGMPRPLDYARRAQGRSTTRPSSRSCATTRAS